VLLGRHVKLEEMADLSLVELMSGFLTDAKLHRVDTIIFESLNLSDLASIKLDDRAGDDGTPIVPEVCHSNLIAQDASPLSVT